ncbi:MAG: hypothetical protein B9J98_07710 [Candidatus Terraquivivens tikiterensis]|uniref:DUF5615 domain-containing protein n=1 Tax=Candidatus Terraquivivens tikiterensis TaxID=1980982 RepID=A0A2R7Y0Q8_9ARCH|nr:MAG: hypothetical protein B9J98_07710 [Candidatus Terraquivivens tikiterensis]
MTEELFFLADENIPFQIVKKLKSAGYKVATVDQIAKPGIRNDELASLAIKHGMIIITRDADLAHLKLDLMRKNQCHMRQVKDGARQNGRIHIK